MPDFHAAPDGATLVLDDVEAGLLRQLTAELRALLVGSRRKREDQVLERLFPAVYETPSDQSAYEDLVGDDLTKEKLRALDVVSLGLERAPEIAITGEDFGTWLACLTDLRLAIGVRLDVDEERMNAAPDAGDPDAQSLAVLHWLGWLQEGLLGSVAS
jgi:hypothetical protein